MKKIFYIVLVIVVLLVIGRLIKQDATTADEGVTVEETIVDENALSASTNPDAIGDGEVVEEEAEDVVEVNPEQTADEDETIVKE